MSHLSLSLLGTFQAHLDDNPLLNFQSDKARALLVYLAVEADRPHSRAQLATRFWPDLLEKRARTYLRHVLANLRKVLGDATTDATTDATVDGATTTEQPFLLVTHHTLQFNQQSHHRLDSADLLTALETMPTNHASAAHSDHLARLQAVVDGYDRPFLDGFFLDDCPAFEEWMLLTRERLQRRVLDALHALAAAYEQAGDDDRARQSSLRCVELEPWREEAHRRVMRLLAQSGQRGAALAQYEQCCRLLRKELDVEPGTETTALYQAILAGEFDEISLSSPQSRTPSSSPHVPLLPLHNLPAELTPLVGRDKAIYTVRALFHQDHARLVTLTGPGGVGKTRLGVAVARAMLDDYVGGVYFVELAAVREPALVLSALAETLDVRKSGSSRSLLEQVVARLKTQHTLLLLDNFEHVVEAAPLLTKLLTGCPYIKVLVTSRASLHLRGEFEFIVPPLTVPNVNAGASDNQIDLDSLASAVELFRQRARAANHEFTLDRSNLAFVAQICRRLDGLPLAIELATAQAKYFTPQALLARLTTRNDHGSLQFLQAALQDAPARHHSLWATIAWSYDLLTPEEQILFRRLTVFVGGWTVEAAMAVCGEGLALNLADSLPNSLIVLVDKHLVRQVQGVTGEPRFMMLETIREFGAAQLQRSDELLTIQRKHMYFYKEVVIDAAPQLRNQNSVQMLAYMREEYANIRAALRWALTQRDVNICLQFCDPLLGFWHISYVKEAETYLLETVEMADADGAPPSVSYVNTLASAGYIAFILGTRARGKLFLERCLAMNEAIGYQGAPTKIGIAHGLLASNMFDAGNYDAARVYWEASLEHAHRARDEWNLAMNLINFGRTVARLGNLDKAHDLIQEGLTLHRRIGQKWGIALALKHLGYLHICQGDLPQAKRVLQESQQLCEEIQSKGMIASLKRDLALVAVEEADYTKAATLLQEALISRHEEGIERNILEVLDTLIQLAVYEARYEDALWLASVVASHYRRLEMILPPLERHKQEEWIALARQSLPKEAAATAWSAGAVMTLDEAVRGTLQTIHQQRLT